MFISASHGHPRHVCMHTGTHSLSLKLRIDTIPPPSVSSRCWFDLWIHYRWVSERFSNAFRSVYVCVFFILHVCTWAQSDSCDVYSIFIYISPVQFTSSKLYTNTLISHGILMFTFNKMLPLFDQGSNPAWMFNLSWFLDLLYHRKTHIDVPSAFYLFMWFSKKDM